MKLTDQSCYLRQLSFREDRTPDSDGAALVVLTIEFPNLTAEICDAIAPGLRSKLFTARGAQVVEELASATINLTVADHVIKLAAAPGVAPNIVILDARPLPSLVVRKVKKAPQYTGVLQFTTSHPTRELLEQLVAGWRKSHLLTLHETQGTLHEVTDDAPRLSSRPVSAEDAPEDVIATAPVTDIARYPGRRRPEAKPAPPLRPGLDRGAH